MSWYKRANIEDDARARVEALLHEMYGGIPGPLIQRWPHYTPTQVTELEKELLTERERRKLKEIETARQAEEDAIVEREVPAEILEHFEVRPAFDENFTRYVWGTKEENQVIIASGLEMNEGHGGLPPGWYYLHVGGEEWVAVLSRDYGRNGPVCEIEITNLPEGFFVVNDIDVMPTGESPDSSILISKQPNIPAQCVKITRVLDTDDIIQDYPEYSEADDEDDDSEGY